MKSLKRFLLLGVLGVLLTGCGVKGEVVVSKSGDTKCVATFYYAENEIDDADKLEQVSVDDKTYWKRVDNSYELPKCVKVDRHYIWISGKDLMSLVGNEDAKGQCEFAEVTVKFADVVTDTNGTIGKGKKEVTFDLKSLAEKGKGAYAFTDGVKAIASTGELTKESVCKVSTPFKCKSIWLNGKKVDKKKLHLKKGQNVIDVNTVCGSQQFIVYRDVVPPVVSGVKNGKVYGKAKDIWVDDTKGIKSFTVNGKKVAGNHFKANKNGVYRIKVADNAGNKTTIVFSVKKKAKVIVV